jgi:hypothetical protein
VVTIDLGGSDQPRPRSTQSAPVDVLYIAGFGRSGSTLLDRLLGQDARLLSAGEVNGVWPRGVLANRMCSCGARFADCQFWQTVSAGPPELLSERNATAIVSYTRRVFPAQTLYWAATAPGRARSWSQRPPGYEALTADLYRSLLAASDGEMVVDSSKHPAYLFHLSQVRSLRLHVVHLIRDPRAVAYSWGRPVVRDPDGRTTMASFGAAKAAFLWLQFNYLTELIARKESLPYLRIRYEDLIANPELMTSRIKAFAGVTGSPMGMRSGPSHILSGNPMRFEHTAPVVRGDNAWKREMAPRSRKAVQALTLPLRLRYGYR